jgi:hypothetical protein
LPSLERVARSRAFPVQIFLCQIERYPENARRLARTGYFTAAPPSKDGCGTVEHVPMERPRRHALETGPEEFKARIRICEASGTRRCPNPDLHFCPSFDALPESLGQTHSVHRFGVAVISEIFAGQTGFAGSVAYNRSLAAAHTIDILPKAV